MKCIFLLLLLFSGSQETYVYSRFTCMYKILLTYSIYYINILKNYYIFVIRVVYLCLYLTDTIFMLFFCHVSYKLVKIYLFLRAKRMFIIVETLVSNLCLPILHMKVVSFRASLAGHWSHPSWEPPLLASTLQQQCQSRGASPF